MVSLPFASVAVAVSALEPKPSGTVAVQFVNPLVEVAATKLTFTEATSADAPELVPCTVMLESVVENPETGLVMATFGPVAAWTFTAHTTAMRSGNAERSDFMSQDYVGQP